MVKLDEEGKRKLYFKKPTISQPLKRKHDDFADSDEEADVWQSAGIHFYKNVIIVLFPLHCIMCLNMAILR